MAMNPYMYPFGQYPQPMYPDGQFPQQQPMNPYNWYYPQAAGQQGLGLQAGGHLSGFGSGVHAGGFVGGQGVGANLGGHIGGHGGQLGFQFGGREDRMRGKKKR